MRFKVECGFDIFDLFIHDKNSVDPLDERTVEYRLNELVECNIRFQCPDQCGLSRWQLLVDENPVFTERPYIRKDVMQHLKKFPELIEKLHDLNRLEFKLLSGVLK